MSFTEYHIHMLGAYKTEIDIFLGRHDLCPDLNETITTVEYVIECVETTIGRVIKVTCRKCGAHRTFGLERI